jgi:hypothetical protein
MVSAATAITVLLVTVCGGCAWLNRADAQHAPALSASVQGLPLAAANGLSRAGSTADAATWKPAAGPLSTRWDKQVSPTNALPDYPRPQMTRAIWQNLNGLWDYALTNSAATTPPANYSGQILVPYPLESALSGVRKASVPDQRLWYRRTFTIPSTWMGQKGQKGQKGQRVLLHFGAVNWDSTVAVNGKMLGAHRGGYDGFEYDITDSIQPGPNELVVSAWNPLRADTADAQVLGKQRMHAEGIFYTGVTGIWQTVWLEPVPDTHIAGLKITPDVDAGTLRLTVYTDHADQSDAAIHSPGDAGGLQVRIAAIDGTKTVAEVAGATETDVPLPIAAPHLWTPADPYLYALKVSLLRNGKTIDSVNSYFAMRKVSLGQDAQGRTRLMLNNQFVFQIGALDQGYWPDGIYTAPTDDALRYDIEVAKKLGYNLLRKHAKVEPERWYYWTDRLGMLVWQDMPQAFGGKDGALTAEVKTQWETEWRREIAEHYNHPSIIVWTTFNEGWGQHDTEQIVALTRALDPTRLVNDASGWVDKGVGDIADTHAYPGPSSGKPEPTRAAVNGEFGGITMRVDGHMWTTDVFGYGNTLQNGWLVTKRYQQLLKTAYRLREERGTSAFVYTQITDVEQESNGILTYDRAVIKPQAAIIRAANEGRFPPLPPNPNPDILPTSEDEPQTWRYTTAKPADNWTRAGFDATGWRSGQAGFGQGVGTVRTPWTTADIWLRRDVTLPATLPDRLVVLAFHDEDVEVYINGVLAASAPGYVGAYVKLPMTPAGRAAIQPGNNLIAVHCHQTIGGQFIDVGIARAAPEK